MKLEERLQKGSVFKLTRVACVLALIGLVMMVYSILSPRPLPVILAMSVGQMFGMAAVACYLLAIVVDMARSPRGGKTVQSMRPPEVKSDSSDDAH